MNDQLDVKKANELDAADELTAGLIGVRLEGGDFSDDEQEDGQEGGGSGLRGGAPPPCAQLSGHFSHLESAEIESDNAYALFHRQKAKMAMIAAHA